MCYSLPAITTVFTAILVAQTPAASAATAPANPSQSLARPGNAAERFSQAEIRSFEQAPVSLTKAIGTAEASSHGSAIDASFVPANGAPLYDIKTVGNGMLWEGQIDAHTGQLVRRPASTPEAQLTAEQKAQVAEAARAKDSLREAVSTAEQGTGGKAISAALAQHEGKLAYDTETVRDGAVMMVSVDLRSGEVLGTRAVPSGTASGSSTAPAATLPGGASTDKSLGEPPPG
ncbi:MAG TPA: PepSY domain-containing protein, partial [Stellaceae bacterium]